MTFLKAARPQTPQPTPGALRNPPPTVRWGHTSLTSPCDIPRDQEHPRLRLPGPSNTSEQEDASAGEVEPRARSPRPGPGWPPARTPTPSMPGALHAEKGSPAESSLNGRRGPPATWKAITPADATVPEAAAKTQPPRVEHAPLSRAPAGTQVATTRARRTRRRSRAETPKDPEPRKGADPSRPTPPLQPQRPPRRGSPKAPQGPQSPPVQPG